MAAFFPPIPAAHAPLSELKVRKALAALDDRWRVFHSVTWQSKRAGRQGDGEADFVLLHPNHGAIVLEVKGGRIDVTNGQWSTVDRAGASHSIKNPFEQAKDSKHALIAFLRARSPELAAIPVCHGVVFPDGSPGGDIGMYGHRDITVGRADLSSVEATLQRIAAHWEQSSQLSNVTVAAFISALAPTTSIRTRLRDRVVDAGEAILELTEQQKRVLAMARGIRRCVVRGGAGTGKTVLAIERVRRLESDGFRTLLLCFNAPLAGFLAAELANTNAEVSTFHAFAMRVLRATGNAVPTAPDNTWWDAQAAYSLAGAVGTRGCPAFDALVIDEAQDFAEDWLTALMMLLTDPESSPVYIFADVRQEIYAQRAKLPEAWPPLTLEVNCRNTLPIATRVAALFEAKPHALGANGLAPVWVDASDEAAQISVVEQMTYRMINEGGLRPEQIVVLADTRTAVERLRQRLAGDEPFVSLGGRGIVAETIHRFKGLEADVVIMLLTQQDSETLLPLAYVGMSRARALLTVVAPKRIRKHLRWTV